MIWLAAHIAGYTAATWSFTKTARRFAARRQHRSKHAMLIRITRLEQELGLGVDWALDRLDTFAPILSRPSFEGYSTLREYAFRCYGCDEEVIYADYNKRPTGKRDSRHLLCDSCLPKEAAA